MSTPPLWSTAKKPSTYSLSSTNSSLPSGSSSTQVTSSSVAAAPMDVVNGEIVMVDTTEGSPTPPDGPPGNNNSNNKRPSTSMVDTNNNNNYYPHDMALSPHQHPNSSRMRLTESGDWACSWGVSEQGNSSRSSDHCGGEYFLGGRGMAFAQHSAVGSFRHASNHAVVSVDGVRRLNNSAFVESVMVGANSSARFQAATLQTMSPVSCGASFRATTNCTTQMVRGSFASPVCYSKGLLSTTLPAPAEPAGKDSCQPGGDHIEPHHHIQRKSNLGISFDQGLLSPFPTAEPPGKAGGHHLGRPVGATGSCQPRRERHDRHRHIQGKSPGKSFNEEMADYESQIAKIAFNNIMRPPPGRSPPRPKETLMLQDKGPHTKLAGSADLSESTNSDVVSLSPVDSSLPTQNLPNRGDVKVYMWIEPLRFLLRKCLTVSDVGELGRVVLPKKDAEGYLPHVEVKEGVLIPMVDHNRLKQWMFRYKWWLNNKSRMYVLENTGEFVKYHDLKEKDAMTLYEDGVGTIVVSGEKNEGSL